VNESALYPRPRMNKREAVYYDNRTMDDVTVVGLPPNSTVLIQIRVLTKYYVGPASDPVRVTTPEGGMFDALLILILLDVCLLYLSLKGSMVGSAGKKSLVASKMTTLTVTTLTVTTLTVTTLTVTTLTVTTLTVTTLTVHCCQHSLCQQRCCLILQSVAFC